MRVITERENIKDVKRRWREQYPNDDYKFWDDQTAGAVFERLDALDLETCSPDDVAEALGGNRWADNVCAECKQHKKLLVRIGDEPDYEARWQDLCEDCLQSAIASIENCK